MSVFTPVSPEQLAGWLEAYAVGPLLALEGIAEGAENTNSVVTTGQGRFVLTLFERLGADELPFYVQLMVHLARRGIPCPAPVADREGGFLGCLNGRPAVLASFLPGASVASPGLAHCAAAGYMLARLHRAGLDFPGRLDNPRGADWRRETAPRVVSFLDGADQALLTEELRAQSMARTIALPRGVIHADLFRDNVLFEGERLSGVLDFYFAGQDCLLFDLAVTVNDWCGTAGGELDGARAAALLSAYHGVRPLTAPELAAWPLMLRAAALRFWLSRLMDSHQPRAGALVTVRDPAHFRNILARRVEMGANVPWM